MSNRIQAIKVDYTFEPVKDGARYEPEQSFYWALMLNVLAPSKDWSAKPTKSAYVDNSGNPLWFVRIAHTSGKTLYARRLELIEL